MVGGWRFAAGPVRAKSSPRSRDAANVLLWRANKIRRVASIQYSIFNIQGQTFESVDSAPAPHAHISTNTSVLAKHIRQSSEVIGSSGHWTSSLHVGFCRLASMHVILFYFTERQLKLSPIRDQNLSGFCY
jgi:hypothetical protein